jgi:hypothetical protein
LLHFLALWLCLAFAQVCEWALLSIFSCTLRFVGKETSLCSALSSKRCAYTAHLRHFALRDISWSVEQSFRVAVLCFRVLGRYKSELRRASATNTRLVHSSSERRTSRWSEQPGPYASHFVRRYDAQDCRSTWRYANKEVDGL